MRQQPTRRTFLQLSAAGGMLSSLGDLSFLSQLQPVYGEDTQLNPQFVKFDDSIEPLVKLLEETPREQLLERVADRIRNGTQYKEILAALLLAGVRNIEPRPSVGFKFHAVLVVNSAHMASIASPPEQRWLPIFWALDQFKESQAADERERHWTMPVVEERLVPAPEKARSAFIDAMNRWDVEAADVAVAGLVRSAPPDEIFELFYRFGARDFRDIGHKAIYVANCRRTLDVIGWQYAEPVLRSLAYALQRHDGQNPAASELAPDQPWKSNLAFADQIPAGWRDGAVSPQATRDLLSALREKSAADACRAALDQLQGGVTVQSLWDALFLGSGELLMRQPGIVALHAMTTTNALRYAFGATSDETTRRMMLLQNVAFVTLFRDAMRARGSVGDVQVDQLEPLVPQQQGLEAVEEIFADVSSNRLQAARKIVSVVQAGGDAKPLLDTARLLVFLKGNNAHDYKFSAAVLEDFAHVSPDWRDRFLASTVFNLRGSGSADNPLVARTRAALEQ